MPRPRMTSPTRYRIAVALTAVLALTSAGCAARFPRQTATQGSGVVVDDGSGQVIDDTGQPVDPGTAPLPGETVAPGTGATAGPGGGPTTPGTSGGPTGGSTTAGGPVEPGKRPGITANGIKIGYLLPLTGAAPVPSSFDKGANAYWKYVNDRGGIFGRQVTVLIEDTESNAATGKAKAQKLIDSGVFMVVALDRLGNQDEIARYLDSRQVPNVAVQTPANFPSKYSWTFGVTIDHAVQGKMIADYFKKRLNAQKVAMVREDDATLNPGHTAFVNQAKALGMQVTYDTTINGKDSDFTAQATALANSGATATWLYMAPTPAANIATTADSFGYHPTWFANSISWNFNLALAVAPNAFRGARAFSPWYPLSDPHTNTYKAAYQAQYNETPDDLGIVGWGIGEIVAEGFRRAGKDMGQNSYRDAMQNLKFTPSVWAPQSFGPGVREGANVVAVFKQAGSGLNSHWELEQSFTGSI